MSRHASCLEKRHCVALRLVFDGLWHPFHLFPLPCPLRVFHFEWENIDVSWASSVKTLLPINLSLGTSTAMRSTVFGPCVALLVPTKGPQKRIAGPFGLPWAARGC